jgi:methionyl-tRNA formyltransferase
MNLDKQTGISIMKIDEKLDTGLVCNSYPLNILENENSESLSERLSLLAAEKILDNIDAILEDKAVFKPQDDTKVTYANKILKSETRIDWSESAKNIIGKINGLYPNSFFIYNGERYKLLKAEASSKIGEIGIVLSDNLEIACKEGSIKVLEIQKEGKRPQKINEFMHGSQIKKGSNLNNA